MDTPRVPNLDLHLERLRAFQESLVAALGERGYGGARLAEVLDRHVVARCAQCGIGVTGGEIAAALAAENAHAAANPRHARLLQRYCARNGCPSYFYRLEFLPVPDLDWAACLARAGEIETGHVAGRSSETAAERARLVREQRRRWLRVGGLVAVLPALWALRRWWITGSLPGLPEKPKYRIDPRSTPAERPGSRTP